MNGSRPPARIGSLCRIVLLVRDMASSLAFYRDLLGLPAAGRVSEDWAVLDAGSGILLCLRATGDGTPRSPRDAGPSPDELLLCVDNLAMARARLIARGVEPRESHNPAPDLTVIELTDPDGRRIALEHRQAEA